MKKIISLLLVIAMLATICCACGKEETETKKLIVATSTGFEPFEMVDNGKYSGIDLEIAAGLAEYLGYELEIQDMQFESVVTSVQQGLCNIGMAGLTITPARQEVVTFSDSYYSANQVLVVPADNTEFDGCKTAEDVVAILNAKNADCKIGCQKGTTGSIYITGDAEDPDGYGFAGLPVTKMEYDYAALAFTAMANKQIDYVIVDNAPANAIAKSFEGKVKVIDIALSEEAYAFCVGKADADLLAKVNEYLAKIKADGTFDKICNNYFGDGTPAEIEG